MALEPFAPDRGVVPSKSSWRQRRDIDWNAIECDYRTGSLSLRELAVKHGCSHSAIANFAGRHGWARNPPPCPPVEGKASQREGNRNAGDACNDRLNAACVGYPKQPIMLVVGFAGREPSDRCRRLARSVSTAAINRRDPA
jgi:hypothetical protein